jgi:hypothetical protein
MYTRQAAAILCFLLLSGCGPNRLELYQRLPEADKELYARTKQFMTDRQQQRFLKTKDSDERVRFIESLHIHDRMKKFPDHQRAAILGGRVVPGMGAEAVMLAWGRPLEIDRRQADGVATQCWIYERGDEQGKVREFRVYFVQGLVTEISQ